MSRAGYRNGQGAMNQGRKCGHMHWPHQEETKALLMCMCVPYLWRHRQSMSCSHVQSHSFGDFMGVPRLACSSEPAQVHAQHYELAHASEKRVTMGSCWSGFAPVQSSRQAPIPCEQCQRAVPGVDCG